jgi:small subunit ribosomal protein S11
MNKKTDIRQNILNLKKLNLFNTLKHGTQKGIIHIKCSFNNTIITLTSLDGKTKAYCSSGSVGFKGAKRSSRFAGQVAAEYLGKKARKLGYKYVKVNFKGFGRGRIVCMRGLKKSRLRIKKIEDVTSLSHNGCRPKKLRRL